MSEALPTSENKGSFAVLLRFLPMLWPRGATELRIRVVIAVLLVLAGKAIGLTVPYALKWVVDSMSGPPGANLAGAAQAVVLLVLAYAGARFGGVLFDNLRNAIFEKVGQDAARRLADAGPFPRPLRWRAGRGLDMPSTTKGTWIVLALP